MGSLFSVFDPMTEIFGLNLSLNWLLVLLLMPWMKSFWLRSSSNKLILINLFNMMYEDVSVNFKSLVNKTSMIMFMSMSWFIWKMNVLGLLPYVFSLTAHISITLSLALPLWVGCMSLSLISQFNHNMAHLVPEGTPSFLMPLMVVIESISLIIRPFTLAIRLFANMVAGHLLISLLSNMCVEVGVLIKMIIFTILSALMLLELAVSNIQCYVFCSLSALYSSEHNSKILSVK